MWPTVIALSVILFPIFVWNCIASSKKEAEKPYDVDPSLGAPIYFVLALITAPGFFFGLFFIKAVLLDIF